MANSYKEIIITPNKSHASENPKIEFRGGNTTVNTAITIHAYPTSSGTLSFEGTAGQLFSVTNDMSGSIYSVNDVSGIPSIEVFANGQVTLAQYGGKAGIGTSAPNGKLEVSSSASGSVVNALTLSNPVGASAGTGVALYFNPNGAGSAVRSASIQSVQTTSGNYADMRFITAPGDTPLERVRITSEGKVGIGTSAPLEELVVSGTGGPGTVAGYRNTIYLKHPSSVSNQSNVLAFGSAGSGGCSIINDISANGTTVNRLDVYAGSGGGVFLGNGATAWASASDERGKDIIEPILNAVEKVGMLRAVIGKYKTDAEGTRRSFLIAQDVQAVLPEAVIVGTDEQQTLGVAYTDTIPLLVAAIKELTARVAQLEGK